MAGWLLPGLPGVPFLWLLLGPCFVFVSVSTFLFFHLWPTALWPHWPLRWLRTLIQGRFYHVLLLIGFIDPFIRLYFSLIGILAVWQFFGAFVVWLFGLCCSLCICLCWSLWPSGIIAQHKAIRASSHSRHLDVYEAL